MSLQFRREDILLCFLYCSFHLKTSIIFLFIQLVFSLSSQQQKLDLKTLNDRLKQQCLHDRKNNTSDPSKCIFELTFANFIDSFTKTWRKTFWVLTEERCTALASFTCFPELTASLRGFHDFPRLLRLTISRVITGYRLFFRAIRRLHVPHWLCNIPHKLLLLPQFTCSLAPVTCVLRVYNWLSLHTSQVAQIRSALISAFSCMKRSGVFLLSPGWDVSPSQGYPQHFTGTQKYTWVERGTAMRV